MTPEAAAIRATITREVVDPSKVVADELAAWNATALELPLSDDIHEHQVSIGGVACRTLRATGARSDRPLLVYAHGGGFITGSALTHRQFGSSLARAVDAEVVLVDYRLLPKHPIAAPIADLVRVVEALAPERGRHRPIVLGGDSSGATLAVSAAVALRDGAGSPLTALVSISGAFDATLASPSIDEGLDPQLDRAVLEDWRETIASVEEPSDPRVSPVFADLGGLPPMLLLAGDHDVWRDDSVRLAAVVTAAGGTAERHVVDEMWHCWPIWGDFPEARAALERCAEFVDRHSEPV